MRLRDCPAGPVRFNEGRFQGELVCRKVNPLIRNLWNPASRRPYTVVPDAFREKGKTMRRFPFATLTAVAVSLSLLPLGPVPAAGQESAANQHLVLGYRDTQTGQFHPVNRVVPEATVAPITGTITVKLHITLKTPMATGDKVVCTAEVLASYIAAAGSTIYTETDSSLATVSGTTATCTLSIPHSWQFPAVTSTDIENLEGSYSAEIVNPNATTTAQLFLARSSGSDFVSLTGKNVFASAPSAFSVNVTL